MNWYYAEAGQQFGPITEEDLLGLAASGKIRPDTLVWHDGMANWEIYERARPAGVAAPPGVSSVTPATTGQPEVVCVECGKVVTRDNAIAYGSNWVCAACKPVYFQKLREGAALPALAGEMAYGGFWIRFLAKFIDMFLIGLVLIIPAVLLGVGLFGPRMGRIGIPNSALSTGIALQLLFQLGSIVVTMLYNWFFVAKYGATPGKMACSLKVVTPTGAPLTSSHALGRAAAELLSGLTCDIGYLIAAFDKQKRALHDHVASTRVIKK